MKLRNGFECALVNTRKLASVGELIVTLLSNSHDAILVYCSEREVTVRDHNFDDVPIMKMPVSFHTRTLLQLDNNGRQISLFMDCLCYPTTNITPPPEHSLNLAP